MKKPVIYYLLPIICYLLLTSCEADQEYSAWPCRFSYNNLIHQDATLATALDKNSRGVFCMITESTRAGAKYLNFQNSDGLSTSKVESEEEVQARFVLGLNNGGIVLNGEKGDSGLEKYVANTTGSFGVVSVFRR